jgi:hypothetical protein
VSHTLADVVNKGHCPDHVVRRNQGGDPRCLLHLLDVESGGRRHLEQITVKSLGKQHTLAVQSVCVESCEISVQQFRKDLKEVSADDLFRGQEHVCSQPSVPSSDDEFLVSDEDAMRSIVLQPTQERLI